MRWSVLGSLFLVAIVGTIVFLNSNGIAKDKPELGKQWAAQQYVSMNQIDHSTFDALLKRYVDKDGFVNYASWKRSNADRQALQSYLARLSQATPAVEATRESQIAFWINAYNAVTLEGILQVYPTTSIRKHTSKFGGYNIWDDLPLLVGGKKYSLNDMEHKVLRKMQEPRIHFAIVCASIGCPRLFNQAYTPKLLNQQLTTNTVDFFSRSQNFKVDNGGTMHVSSILKWFGSDFGDTQVKRFTYLQPYLPKNAQQLAVHPRTRVKFQSYNWSLNEQKQ